MQIDRHQMRTGLIVLGMTVAFVAAVWWPHVRQSAGLNGQIAALDSELAHKRQQVENAVHLQEELDQLEHELAGNNKQISPRQDVAGLLRQINGQIAQEELGDQNLTTHPQKSVNRDYTILPIELRFAGDSVSAFRFVRRVEQMPRLVQLRHLDMRADVERSSRVEVTMGIDAFFGTAAEQAAQ